MTTRSPLDVAKELGLTVESVSIADHSEPVHRILKGVNQIFQGTEIELSAFLAEYEKDRPKPYEGSVYGYKE
ncbi:MAG: hypothetical protein ABI999_17490 [Acidobacteriota bacterium]